MPELWDGNNGPIAEGNLFHSCAEGQILYYFFPPSHDIMGVYGPLQPLHMYTYRGVAVQLLLFILCDPLLYVISYLFIYGGILLVMTSWEPKNLKGLSKTYWS